MVLASGALLLAGLCLAGSAAGQSAVKWEVPGETIVIDYQSALPDRPSFLPDGMAWESPLSFAMLRARLIVAAKLPEAGRFELAVKSSDALVRTKALEAGPREARVEVQGRLPVLSRQDAVKQATARIEALLAEPLRQAEAEALRTVPPAMRDFLKASKLPVPDDADALRSAWARARAADLAADATRTRLQEFIADRPFWASDTEQMEWRRMKGVALMEIYHKYVTLSIAEEHLKTCGFKLDTATRNFEALILAKLDGLHALASGAAIDADPELQRAVRSLTREELAGIRKALTVEAVGRYYPASDPADANSQWYNAQRVASWARGAPTIQLVGTLDPARGDRADWWTLTRFDEARVRLRVGPAGSVRYELYPVAPQTARLRIVAEDDRAVSYSIELLSRTAGEDAGQPVVTHESPFVADAKFPY